MSTAPYHPDTLSPDWSDSQRLDVCAALATSLLRHLDDPADMTRFQIGEVVWNILYVAQTSAPFLNQHCDLILDTLRKEEGR